MRVLRTGWQRRVLRGQGQAGFQLRDSADERSHKGPNCRCHFGLNLRRNGNRLDGDGRHNRCRLRKRCSSKDPFFGNCSKTTRRGSRERRVAAGPVAESDRRPADDRRGESRGTARDGRRDHTRRTPTSSAVIRAAAAVILSSASEDTPEAGVVLVLPSGSQSRLKNASVSHGRRRTSLDAAIAGVSHGRSANGCSTIAGRRPPDADPEAGGAGRRSDGFRNSAWPLAGLCPCRTWADNTRLLRPVQGAARFRSGGQKDSRQKNGSDALASQIDFSAINFSAIGPSQTMPLLVQAWPPSLTPPPRAGDLFRPRPCHASAPAADVPSS